ncbi:MAG TPA: VWA domain-containing protein, partial [Spirochaetota bacterium]|nr:VWA domain-containing protein [Spirochaetota bacterium]
MKKISLLSNRLLYMISALVVFFCLSGGVARAEDMAVLPYAVETISRDFTVDEGSEYAKLVALGARIEKNIDVYSFRETEKDIARLALDPQGKISKDDLNLFCKSRYLQYAVIGRVSKTDGGFAARGVLYSASRNEVIARSSVKGRTIAECAARETDELFSRFSDAVKKKEGRKAKDLVILLDASYTVTQDWKDIYRGLVSLTSGLIDGSPDTDIHLIPYAEKFKSYGSYPSIGSVPAMKEALDALKKRGSGSGKAFGAALTFALDNVSWRSDADRTLLVIANSPVDDTSLDRYGTRAKKMRVRIHTIILGNVSGRDSELYRRLSRMTGGVSSDVSYRQTVFDKKGDEYYLYMNGGRLFEGDGRTDAWKDGVLRIADHG